MKASIRNMRASIRYDSRTYMAVRRYLIYIYNKKKDKGADSGTDIGLCVCEWGWGSVVREDMKYHHGIVVMIT